MTAAALAAEMACNRCHCRRPARQEHAASQTGARQELAAGRPPHCSKQRHAAENDRSAARQTHAASRRPAD
eukprot:15450010-Alexandrium_andersonii.AAC.1